MATDKELLSEIPREQFSMERVMFKPGDGMIFIGDATTHGGRVISGQPNYTVNGRAAAVVGDMVACPKKGHGVCPIIEGHPTIIINGKQVALYWLWL